jgi:hypothetical protein
MGDPAIPVLPRPWSQVLLIALLLATATLGLRAVRRA